MNKKIGIIIASCVAAVVIIGGAVWYLAAGNQNKEDPKNAKNVSAIVDTENSLTAEDETGNAQSSDQTARPAGQSQNDGQTSPNGGTAATAAPQKVTPTFMYFVTNADQESEAVQTALDTLKKEYEGRVIFDIKNVDEDPELLESFSFVKGNTGADHAGHE